MQPIANNIPAWFQIHPEQQSLTPEQALEAEHFAAERIVAQLSTKKVNEQEAEAWLRQAYHVAGLESPSTILWLDGPLQLATHMDTNAVDTAANSAGVSLRKSIEVNIWKHVTASVEPDILSNIEAIVGRQVAINVWEFVGRSIWDSLRNSARASVEAYQEASWLALYHYYAAHLVPNELRALAYFNECVSGYWLGKQHAIIIRRPKVLSRDVDGQLHSDTGRCIEYHDGWGFCAWHGLIVPDKIILAPEQLTREDFLGEQNLEIRRLIQERMGERFVPEMGGYVIESGPRGTLYEVQLPDDDWEQVARYIQVQDASTPRQYFLRVPPTIQTAAEAVAWSFGLSVEEYNPVKET